ncbi:MAG: hypothetical protein KJ556_13920 [Gammaproteobacteria bacterium]|nr:hypothetical protein [Gammaproteobacteria bacterium]MBU2059493.1 hypothetical protein [Gammaproteobacteria bacterium]MBU2176213.1 hypothetical protein [Gammaproteobacteria bacterium]MBU2248146.1 hypothetical protein [Gammaproteobacteria bacterium]MBU2344573.1 hypothetical protein [Gammaproteobacteria bacterium]
MEIVLEMIFAVQTVAILRLATDAFDLTREMKNFPFQFENVNLTLKAVVSRFYDASILNFVNAKRGIFTGREREWSCVVEVV